MLSDRFRAVVEQGNLDEAAALFSEDATLGGPALFKPYEGRGVVMKVLQAAVRVLGLGGEFRCRSSGLTSSPSATTARLQRSRR